MKKKTTRHYTHATRNCEKNASRLKNAKRTRPTHRPKTLVPPRTIGYSDRYPTRGTAMKPVLILVLLAVSSSLSLGADLPRSIPEAQGVSSAAVLTFVEAAD